VKLYLAQTPAWPAPYGDRDALVPLPDRMRYLHPAALRSLSTSGVGGPFELAGPLTDCFRSPTASLQARREKRGVQPPGYSAHNLGLAIDCDVGRTLAERSWRKSELDSWMAARGWQCYRDDHDAGASEAWHYTYGADGPGSLAVEQVIQRTYGDQFDYGDSTLQTYLRELRLYDGAIDGLVKSQTLAAVRAFQLSMELPVGPADARTRRVLAVAAAEKVPVDPATWSGPPGLLRVP
jgi:putative peptidoglycan binding protein